MSVEPGDFSRTLKEWLDGQPSTVKTQVRPQMWGELLQLGQPSADGSRLAFSETQVQNAFFGNEPGVREQVVVPLVNFLNEQYGSGQPTSSKARPEPRKVARGVSRPTAAPGVATETPASEATPVANKPENRQEHNVIPERSYNFPIHDYSRAGTGKWGEVAVAQSDDLMTYTWNPSAENVVYRVVVSDDVEPYEPGLGTTVATIETTQATDSSPITSPYRFVYVWEYPGPLPGQATLGQGRLIARTLHVHQLRGIHIEYSDGNIVGRWEPVGSQYSDVSVQVRVARLPEGHSPASYLNAFAWQQYCFADDGTGFRTGFLDQQVEEGHKYYYVAAVSAMFDNAEQRSAPTVMPFEVVPNQLDRVNDLTVTSEEGISDKWRLEWTNPEVGEVWIYRTPRRPELELAEMEGISAEQLSQANLQEGYLIKTPHVPLRLSDGTIEAGRWSIPGVSWPKHEGTFEEWESVFYTPVTKVGDRFVIGTTAAQVRPYDVKNLTIMQRLNWQLVTFAWPGNAVNVSLYVSARGEGMPVNSEPTATIEKQVYKRSGGFALIPPIPAKGATVHATSMSYFSGERRVSEPVSLDVPPLWGFGYDLDWPLVKNFISHKNIVQVTVRAMRGQCPQDALPLLVLVHNPNQLPLHAWDGQPVPLLPDKQSQDLHPPVTTIPAPANGEYTFYFDAEAFDGGYFRLMVASYPEHFQGADPERCLERYALVDPSLSDLRNR